MAEATPAQPRERVAQALSRLWWLPLLRGIMFIILGCYALTKPGMTATALAQVIGFLAIFEGTIFIVAGIMGEVPSRGWSIFRGLVEVLAGAFVFANPFLFTVVAGTTLVYMLAFAAVFSGILEIIAAIKDRKEIEGEGWIILGGVLSVIFGLILLSAPLAFGVFIVRVLGAFAIFSGVTMITYAFRLRKLGQKLADHNTVQEEGS